MFTLVLGKLTLLNVLQTTNEEVIQYLTTKLDCLSIFFTKAEPRTVAMHVLTSSLPQSSPLPSPTGRTLFHLSVWQLPWRCWYCFLVVTKRTDT